MRLYPPQTGSGKTVAFGLNFAPTILGEASHFAGAANPLALIIAPTRELALQVKRELEMALRIYRCQNCLLRWRDGYAH